MNAFDIVKMIKGNSDIAKMAVNDPQTFTEAIQKLGEHIPTDGAIKQKRQLAALLNCRVHQISAGFKPG
jgi:hypothetical protein